VRPRNIIGFERLMLGSVALGVINVAIIWAELAEASASIGGGFFVGFLVVIGVIVGLTLLISRRRSRIALWIVVVLFVIGVPSTTKLIIVSITRPTGIVMAIQAICQAVAVVLLFTPSVRRWMSRKPDPAAEAEIFS
jgi:hypothetical protein